MRLCIGQAAKICFALILLASGTLVAQDLAKAAPTNPIDGGNLVSLARWRVSGKEGHLRCEVSQETATADNLPMRILKIYREGVEKPETIFRFETPDSVLNMYPLGDYNGRLFTTWVGGSAYHLRVWAFLEGKVKQVLDEGTKIAPEVLYDDQGRESILVTDPALRDGKWTAKIGTTTVFKWAGQSYEKIGTVPWVKRFQCVSKESCASLK